MNLTRFHLDYAYAQWCHAEKLVAFSCQRRGWCPSCGARRMADTAELLDVLLATCSTIPSAAFDADRPYGTLPAAAGIRHTQAM